MGNLIRMDLYRMNKAKSFRVCLIIAFALALFGNTPLEKLMYTIATMMKAQDLEPFAASTSLSGMISKPYTDGLFAAPIVMLALLSTVHFYYADMEGGYIKNIAGQMPKKGFTILSRFIATLPLNLLFMLASLVGNLIGTLPFRQIVVDGGVMEAVGIFLLKILLLQSISSVLLLFTASFRNKSMGVVLAVLWGLSVMELIYLGISSGLQQVFGKSFSIKPYMPDQVLFEPKPALIRALLVSAVTIGIFLPLSIRVFDKKDVK